MLRILRANSLPCVLIVYMKEMGWGAGGGGGGGRGKTIINLISEEEEEENRVTL